MHDALTLRYRHSYWKSSVMYVLVKEATANSDQLCTTSLKRSQMVVKLVMLRLGTCTIDFSSSILNCITSDEFQPLVVDMV